MSEVENHTCATCKEIKDHTDCSIFRAARETQVAYVRADRFGCTWWTGAGMMRSEDVGCDQSWQDTMRQRVESKTVAEE